MGLAMGVVMAGFSSNAMNYQPTANVKMGQAVSFFSRRTLTRLNDTPQDAPFDVSLARAISLPDLQFREGIVAMRRGAISQAKTFALIGGLITLIECPLEQYRGRHDMKNAVVAGSITGAVLAARAGPKAMVLGAVGFAAFGMVMDTFFRDLFGGGG